MPYVVEVSADVAVLAAVYFGGRKHVDVAEDVVSHSCVIEWKGFGPETPDAK